MSLRSIVAVTFAGLALPSLALACGKESFRAEAPAPAPADLLIGDPEPAPVVAATAATAATAAAAEEAEAAVDAAAPGGDALPSAWLAGPALPKLAFSDAIQRARTSRDAVLRLGPAPAPAAPAPAAASAADASPDDALKAWFGKAFAAAERASRMYAAAFHAEGAPREGRIDAIAEAAELALALSRRLDDAGLGSMPRAWRSDPALASTFEDVAVGPTRRWRDEARVLARRCVETAGELAVTTDAARRCAGMRTGLPLAKVTKRDADGGACACSPGDPLCSASLGGWCGR